MSAQRSSTRSRSRNGSSIARGDPRPRLGGGATRKRAAGSLGRRFEPLARRLEPLARRLEQWMADWARRRQGPDQNTVILRRRRIYILPTRYGAIFACLVFAMLLGSLNYGVSLAYALTFLLGAFGLIAMHHCHNNLLGVGVRFAGAAPVFAGDTAGFRIAVANDAGVARYEIELAAAGKESGPVDVQPGESAVLQLAVPTVRRGWVGLPRFSVATRHPGNLCRAWTWVHMDAKCLVYPQPAAPGRPAPFAADEQGSPLATQRGDTDFAGLRNAVPGDSPRRIAWKAYARSGQLLLKQFSGGEDRAELFDWNALSGLATEERLSQLTRWCLDAAVTGRSFGLRLPSETIRLGNGEKHLHTCLMTLALFREPDDGVPVS